MTLAPVSPSMSRSWRSSPRSPNAAPITGAMAMPIGAAPMAMAIGTYATSPNLIVRPGARSRRFPRLAASAISMASTMSVRPDLKPGVATRTTAMAAPPTSFSMPVVTRPSRSAPRCPLNPRSSPTAVRSSTNPRNPKPNTANSTAVRASLRPVSGPTPRAPSTDLPASITSTVRMMNSPPAVASVWLR